MSLQVEGLIVDLGGRRIVSAIDLKVPDRAFVGLLGPNGSGKSTILKAIYRGLRPTGGRVLLDGDDLLAMPPRVAARRVAVVAQESSLDFDVTALEMVSIGRTPHKRGIARDDEIDRAAVRQAMGRTRCNHLAQRSYNTLSGGENSGSSSPGPWPRAPIT